jgi:hypothetical protein
MLCPVCRANNDSGPTCRRCKADLSPLFDLESRRGELLAAAQARLGNEAALGAAQAADDLRHGADARQLVALASLLAGDHAGAWQAYQRARAER